MLFNTKRERKKNRNSMLNMGLEGKKNEIGFSCISNGETCMKKYT